LCRKPGQHVHRIIADRKEGNRGALASGETALQLHELRLAAWSPRSAAVEEHQGAMMASGVVQINEIAMLIWEDAIREAVSNCRADLAQVNGTHHTRSSFLCTLLRCCIGAKGAKNARSFHCALQCAQRRGDNLSLPQGQSCVPQASAARPCRRWRARRAGMRLAGLVARRNSTAPRLWVSRCNQAWPCATCAHCPD